MGHPHITHGHPTHPWPSPHTPGWLSHAGLTYVYRQPNYVVYFVPSLGGLDDTRDPKGEPVTTLKRIDRRRDCSTHKQSAWQDEI